MIKIAICDDEKCFIDAIEKMLKTYAEKNGQDFLIKKYTKPLQLMEALKEEFQIFFSRYRDACHEWSGIGRCHT